MIMKIQIHAEKCTGCRICELICAFTKHDEFNPKRSRIRIVKMERILVDIPVVCRQCPDSPCVESCPSDALRKDSANIVCVDDACTGCESCREACPFGAISIDPLSDTAIVCDLCHGDPQCVRWCPTGALDLQRSDHPSQESGHHAVSVTAKSLLSKWGIPGEEYEKYHGESVLTKTEERE
jgi:Fe-S-cluster-containing hydrogenase component 2